MLTVNISMSLDGFVAGPDQTLEKPLGEGGDRLHEWAFPVAGFREQHGCCCTAPVPRCETASRRTSPASQPLWGIRVDTRIGRRLVVVDAVLEMRWLRVGAVELVRRVRYVAVQQASARAGPA